MVVFLPRERSKAPAADRKGKASATSVAADGRKSAELLEALTDGRKASKPGHQQLSVASMLARSGTHERAQDRAAAQRKAEALSEAHC